MSSSLASKEDSEDQNPCFYSRKDKSLGVLCTNFLSLYNRDGVESIGLDDAASKLGVERRRLYDIVNIFESVGLMERKGKNQYSWKGFGAIPRELERLKEEGLREKANISKCCNSSNVSEDYERGPLSGKIDGQGNSSGSSRIEIKREKSLVLLSENFVKLLLCSDVDLITLEGSAMALLEEGYSSIVMRSKVRRLYDIANVLSSIDLIEKTHHPKTRKPAFRWLGMKQNCKTRSATVSDLSECKKRVFGTDITNCDLKRSKVKTSRNWKSNSKINMQTSMVLIDLEKDYDTNKLEQPPKHSTKSFVYGPFTPASVPKAEDSGNKSRRQGQDWESLFSSHSPQYCNQALNGLFSHYVEAWNSWNIEVAGKKQMQQLS